MSFEAGRQQWERRYDEAVALLFRRRLSAALNVLRKLRTWQHRGGYDAADHSWHDAEVLWLEGVALERARRHEAARVIWHRLAKLAVKESRFGWWVLPICTTCADRTVSFMPRWHDVAKEIRPILGHEALVVEHFAARVRQHQLSDA